MSTFEDELEDQILRATMVEELEDQQRVDREELEAVVVEGRKWDAYRIRARIYFRQRRIWRLL